MTSHDPHDDALDARARALHAQSLAHLSPRVQAQLAQRRRAAVEGRAVERRRTLLPWAGAATAGLALALVMQLHPPAPRGSATAPRVASSNPTASHSTPRTAPADANTPRVAALGDSDALSTDLSEDPDFYLWLGDERPARTE